MELVGWMLLALNESAWTECDHSTHWCQGRQSWSRELELISTMRQIVGQFWLHACCVFGFWLRVYYYLKGSISIESGLKNSSLLKRGSQCFQKLSWGLISDHELLLCSLEMGLWCCKADRSLRLDCSCLDILSYPSPCCCAPPHTLPHPKKNQRMLWNRKHLVFVNPDNIKRKLSCVMCIWQGWLLLLSWA